MPPRWNGTPAGAGPTTLAAGMLVALRALSRMRSARFKASRSASIAHPFRIGRLASGNGRFGKHALPVASDYSGQAFYLGILDARPAPLGFKLRLRLRKLAREPFDFPAQVTFA